MIEGQQGRVFEREHREGRHQDIGQGEFNLARPLVRNRTEKGVEKSEECIGGEMLAYLPGGDGHDRQLHLPMR
jgi:hypothetical protein